MNKIRDDISIVPGVPKKGNRFDQGWCKELSSNQSEIIFELFLDGIIEDRYLVCYIRKSREDIFILKVQICLHLENRAFKVWLKLQTRCFGESPQGQT